MSEVAPPAVVTAADDLLPLARDAVDRESDRLIAEGDVSCRAGCSACCAQAVPVRPCEVRAIVDHLDQLDPATRRKIDRRIERARDRLTAAGIEHLPERPEDRGELGRRYFAAGVPCPLLADDGTCSVRPVRPLACREYLVTSDPVLCANPEGAIVRIRSTRDVLTGFGKISDALGEPESGWLALALADAVPERPAHRRVSGIQAVQVVVGQRLAPTNAGEPVGQA